MFYIRVISIYKASCFEKSFFHTFFKRATNTLSAVFVVYQNIKKKNQRLYFNCVIVPKFLKVFLWYWLTKYIPHSRYVSYIQQNTWVWSTHFGWPLNDYKNVMKIDRNFGPLRKCIFCGNYMKINYWPNITLHYINIHWTWHDHSLLRFLL